MEMEKKGLLRHKNIAANKMLRIPNYMLFFLIAHLGFINPNWMWLDSLLKTGQLNKLEVGSKMQSLLVQNLES